MMPTTQRLLDIAASGGTINDSEAHVLFGASDLESLLSAARQRRDQAHGTVISYSPKVFIPLTKLCRDVCRYCTFAEPPRRGEQAYLSIEQAIDIARAGAEAGCHEALFTLGDQPERRYRAAREALETLGHDSTIDYLIEAAHAVHEATGLLPHVNPGLMSAEELGRLRRVSVSAGLMLESSAERLTERGGPHHGCPDKTPSLRLASIERAGEAAIPFTSGILVGIGETEAERIDSFLALRALHARHHHLQEIIVQNFQPKLGTAMARAKAPPLNDHLRSIAIARLLFSPEVSIQAPPNLSPTVLDQLLAAGINDWGGVSPVTPDHVNPERPWPPFDTLRRASENAGKELVARLPIYPRYLANADRWLDPAMQLAVRAHADGGGYARENSWTAGEHGKVDSLTAPIPSGDLTPTRHTQAKSNPALTNLLDQAQAGIPLTEDEIARLFSVRGREFDQVINAADHLRQLTSGDVVRYVVNRNINYTNICYFSCRFCAFSKRTRAPVTGDKPYDLDLEEIGRRTKEAWQRGATEVCLQGGIHPDYTGETYIAICRAVKEAASDMHIHAFSPLEVWQGAATLKLPLDQFLNELRQAGLGSLPGTAAEILDDEIRQIICPDKINTEQWLEVMRSAHSVGLRSTATIMFGHVDGPVHWARHLNRVRTLQTQTGGFTEFVPLPFVHMESPLYLKGWARPGPTYREALLMHAVPRLVLNPGITNIQASWVKMGPDGSKACLAAGANDLGGTLMNESITRAAGADFGQELPPEAMEKLIRTSQRIPEQRTTFYAEVPTERTQQSFGADALEANINTAPGARKSHSRSEIVRFGPRQ